MKALVKSQGSLGVQEVPRPELRADDDVLIRVVVAGLCRTDLYVAQGLCPAALPVVLGHELSGIVREVGPAARDLTPGDRVTVMPLLPGGQMLGVHRDGAFAEYLVVPAGAVHRLPAALGPKVGAYCEPVAAALAVLRAGIQPQERGVIYGDNRIAQLTQRVLRAYGFGDVPIHPLQGPPLPADRFDFLIETAIDSTALRRMMEAARPGGAIVLKSRQHQPVGLDVALAVRKELTLRAVHYAPFPDAIALLAQGAIDVSDLLGEAHPLEDFERAFAAAQADEARKVFLRLS